MNIIIRAPNASSIFRHLTEGVHWTYGHADFLQLSSLSSPYLFPLSFLPHPILHPLLRPSHLEATPELGLHPHAGKKLGQGARRDVFLWFKVGA